MEFLVGDDSYFYNNEEQFVIRRLNRGNKYLGSIFLNIVSRKGTYRISIL